MRTHAELHIVVENGRGCTTIVLDHPMATEHLPVIAQEKANAVIGRWGFHGCIIPQILGGHPGADPTPAHSC